jgi:hypothetical protein
LTPILEHENAISQFEESAAPAGHSLLWDTTDQTYGYVNNFSGEVSMKRPSMKPSEKSSEKSSTKLDVNSSPRVYKATSKSSSRNSSTAWTYGEDGSVSGVLGGGKKRSPLEAYQKSQTDILKDQVIKEKAQRLRQEEVKSIRPKQNEKNDRRLARLGITIETSPEKKTENVAFKPKPNPLNDEKKKEETEKEEEKSEKNDETSIGMEISSEEENQVQEKRKKRRKKEKAVKSKPSDSKVQFLTLLFTEKLPENSKNREANLRVKNEIDLKRDFMIQNLIFDARLRFALLVTTRFITNFPKCS